MMKLLLIVIFLGYFLSINSYLRYKYSQLRDKDESRWKWKAQAQDDLLLMPSLQVELFTLNGNNAESSNFNYKILLKSDVTRFYYPLQHNSSQSVIIDLFSTIHVGEKEYYEQLQSHLERYDIVLHELITNKENIEVNTTHPYRKRLLKPLYSKTMEEVGRRFHLSNQMTLPMHLKSNWFIADLDKETIEQREIRNVPEVNRNYLWSVFGGRAFQEPFFRNFIIPDQWFLTLLRLLTWLTPCPEVNSLLVDWARSYPKAGGLSPLFLPMFHQLTLLRPLKANQIAFTQQMISGLSDAGSWGGESKSDIKVRIVSRNRECCSITQSFLRELEEDSSFTSPAQKKQKRLAIVYGAYHIEDLKQRLIQEVHLQIDHQYRHSLPVWSIVSSSSNSNEEEEVQWSSVNLQDFLRQFFQYPSTSLVMIGSALLYVALGVLDWWISIELLVQIFEMDFSQATSLKDLLIDSSASIAYLWLYLQRHLFFLRLISYSGIQWNQGLFAEF